MKKLQKHNKPYKFKTFTGFFNNLTEKINGNVTKSLQNVSMYITILVEIVKKVKLHLFPIQRKEMYSAGELIEIIHFRKILNF